MNNNSNFHPNQLSRYALNYLYNELNNIKMTKLDEEYSRIYTRQKSIKKFIKHKGGKYTIINDIIYNTKQKGGLLKLNENLLKIREIAKTYKKIDNTDMTNVRDNIKSNLDKVMKQIEDIKNDDQNKVSEIILDNKIQNAFELIKTNISNMANGLQIMQEKVKLYVPINTPLYKQHIITYNEIINETHSQLESIIINKNTDNKTIIAKINELSTNLDTRMMNIDTKINKLTSLNTKNSKINVSFAEKYTTDPKLLESLILVMDIKILRDKCNTSKIAELNKLSKISDIKDREFIDKYNDIIETIDQSTLGDLPPYPFFDGKYEIRIDNNILLQSNIYTSALDILTNLINVDEKDIVFNKANNTDDTKITEIFFNPPFQKMKIGKSQNGGNPLVESIKNIEEKISVYDTKISNMNNIIDTYNELLTIYNTNQMYAVMNNIFLILITTNQVFTTGYTIYNYIGKGTIEFYKRILIKLIEKIDVPNSQIKDDTTLYMKKYHYMTIKKIHNLFVQISGKIKPTDIIDIRKCTDKILNIFILFNYFKSTLNAYHSINLNKINIYARINNIPSNKNKNVVVDTNTNMFISDNEYIELQKSKDIPNSSIMHVITNETTCKPYYDENKNKDTEIKFTEVFNTKDYPNNTDIAKYMMIDTQIAERKGIALMTYGYSGTGKTFTLFGNREINKDGILQATLNGINGLKKIRFRIFEIFGYGLAYPHYWTNPDDKSRMNDIYNKIYHYNGLQTDNNGYLNFEEVNVIEATDIENFMGKASTYFEITKETSSDILRNFDKFVEVIEKYREGKDARKDKFEGKNFIPRVEQTPNNRVSSRSVLVYDFQIYLEQNDTTPEKPIPYIIIDLPGREEIIQTYIDPYMDNETVKDLLDIKNNNTVYYKLKLMLSTMALNPIAVPLFDDSIYDYIKKNHPAILTQKIRMKFYDNAPTDYTFDEEHINKDKQTINERILNSSGVPKLFGYSHKNNSQSRSLLGIHAMNRLVMLNKFDVIKDIYKIVCDKQINNIIKTYVENINKQQIIGIVSDLIKQKFKGDIMINSEIKSFKDLVENINKNIQNIPNITIDNENLSEIKKELIRILSYEYYLTPFAGIYINENIIGLIKYLGGLVTEKKEKIHDILKQNELLNFQYQQKTARVWLMSDSKNNKDDNKVKDFFKFENDQIPKRLFENNNQEITDLEFNGTNLESEYNKFKTTYKSDAIFNYDKPLITDILKQYIKSIDDYKVFYLFGNYDDNITQNLKCKHQIKLLDGTTDFITNIV